MKRTAIFAVVVALFCFSLFASDTPNMLKNGTFDDASGSLSPWVAALPDGVTLVAAPQNWYLQMSNPAPRYNDVTQVITIDPEKTRAITVKALVKIKDVVK